MVSNVPTFSIKMIGQRIQREYVPPLFVLAALFIALLLTYPALTLAVGSVTYIALIPVSAYRYLVAKRRAEAEALETAEPAEPVNEPVKSQSGTGANSADAANSNTRSTRVSAKR